MLTNPTGADNESPISFKQWEELTQAIALKIGNQKYSLSDGDFALRLWSPKKLKGHAFIARRAGIIRVYFAVSPSSPDFANYLDEAMKAVSRLKHSKGTDLIKFSLENHKASEVPRAYRELYGLPILVENPEIVIRHLYKVEVTHKVTGLVVVKEGLMKQNTFTKLTYDAKVEVSELVNAVRAHQAQKVALNEDPPKGAEVDEGSLFEMAEWAE